MCRGDAWTKDESVRLSGRLVRSLRLLTAADEMEGRVVRRSTNLLPRKKRFGRVGDQSTAAEKMELQKEMEGKGREETGGDLLGWVRWKREAVEKLLRWTKRWKVG